MDEFAYYDVWADAEHCLTAEERTCAISNAMRLVGDRFSETVHIARSDRTTVRWQVPREVAHSFKAFINLVPGIICERRYSARPQ